MAIWDFLIKQDTNTQFHFEISVDILKDEEIKLLSNYILGMFFEDKAYFNRNIGNIEYYKVFLDFNEIVLEESNKYINEIVEEDSYYVFNNNNEYVYLGYNYNLITGKIYIFE